MKSDKRTLVLTTLICLLPMLIGAALYSRLPETMETHWDFDGTANGWASRAFAVFGLPAFLLALNFFVPFMLRADPKRGNMSPALKTVVVWTIPAVSLLGGGTTLARGLGYELRIERLAGIFVGLLLVIIGNYLPKTKQSYTMGIRLPWTLASEENWNRTHRLAGFLWVLCGLALSVTVLAGWSVGVLILLPVMVLVPAVYSYLLYRRGV